MRVWIRGDTNELSYQAPPCGQQCWVHTRLRCVRSGGNTSQLGAVADERVSGEDQQCD